MANAHHSCKVRQWVFGVVKHAFDAVGCGELKVRFCSSDPILSIVVTVDFSPGQEILQ